MGLSAIPPSGSPTYTCGRPPRPPANWTRPSPPHTQHALRRRLGCRGLASPLLALSAAKLLEAVYNVDKSLATLKQLLHLAVVLLVHSGSAQLELAVSPKIGSGVLRPSRVH